MCSTDSGDGTSHWNLPRPTEGRFRPPGNLPHGCFVARHRLTPPTASGKLGTRGVACENRRKCLEYSNLAMGAQSRFAISKVLTPPFVVAVILLSLGWAVAGPIANRMGFRRAKLPLPLKAPLDSLDVAALAPYQIRPSRDSAGHLISGRLRLDAPVVEALGTKDYLMWLLEDTSLPSTDPCRFATLFVTYYTGGHSLVPHTPDVCRLGSGWQPAQPHENTTLPWAGSGPRAGSRLPVRVCTFQKSAIHDYDTDTVVYTFHCNGEFVETRLGVRNRVRGFSNRHAYFSKVEISFPDATREESIVGAAKLLSVVSEELIRNHWPDFEAAERGTGSAERD